MPQTVPEMHTALLVLALVSDAPSDRRQIEGALEARTGGALRFDESALRRTVRRLEAAGFLRGRYVMAERGPAVKVLSVTPLGEKRLAGERGHWQQFQGAVESLLPEPAAVEDEAREPAD